MHRLREAAAAPVERVYWYSLIDLDPQRAAIEGFHVDENEYHLGLVRHDGSRKPADEWLKDHLARQGGGSSRARGATPRLGAPAALKREAAKTTSL